MSQDAINQLRSWITEQGLGAFMVTQPQNSSYLSGWLNDDIEGAGRLSCQPLVKTPRPLSLWLRNKAGSRLALKPWPSSMESMKSFVMQAKVSLPLSLLNLVLWISCAR